MRTIKRTLASLAAGATLAVVPVTAANAQSSLVDVTIRNVANDNQVNLTVPVNAAANICGFQVGVLAVQLEQGDVQCTARGGQVVDISSSSGN